jgi:hypothetical protein
MKIIPHRMAKHTAKQGLESGTTVHVNLMDRDYPRDVAIDGSITLK